MSASPTGYGQTLYNLGPWFILAGVLIIYLIAVVRQSSRTNRPWSHWRTASFFAGVGLIAIALSPPLAHLAHHNLRGHMIQHLLIGMVAPLGLVFAAPLTLAFRTLPVRTSRGIISVLRSRPGHWLSHPVTALILNIGGMYLLYLTPLYALTLTTPSLHTLMHIHFLLAGCLFTWTIAGPDPAPNRPRLSIRLIVLFFGIAAHTYLSKLMYIYLWPAHTPYSPAEIQMAAKLMYYGGDLVELLLVIALFATWYRQRGRRPYNYPSAGVNLNYPSP